MGTLTVSNSGTAWIKDMHAQGKVPGDGWAGNPNAAYYASLDGDKPQPKPAQALPTSLAELMKLQQQAGKDNNQELADLLQQQMAKVAAGSGMAPSGNFINVKA